MFGFLRGSKCDRIYRQAYARCCQTQHREFGITSLPFLSYEGVFAYLLSLDAGWTPLPPDDAPLCCRLRRTSRNIPAPDANAATFAAVVGLMLASVKIDDDLRDSRSWAAWLAAKWYRRKFRRVWTRLEHWSPGIETRLRSTIIDHLVLEDATRPIAIAEYVEPTAAAFSQVYEVLPTACGQDDARIQSALRDIGADVGRAIIAFDCAVDWPWDRLRGQFNPLPDEAAVEAARQFAVTCLQRAADRCRGEFGTASHSARLLDTVIGRVTAVASMRDWPSCQRTRERWGLLREPGFTYAKCDGGCDCGGCDCGAGACGDCGAGGCDCGAGGCDCGAGGCDPGAAGCPGDAACAPGHCGGCGAAPVEVVPPAGDVPAPPVEARPPINCGCFDCLLCCDCGHGCGSSKPAPLTKSGRPKVRPEDEQVC